MATVSKTWSTLRQKISGEFALERPSLSKDTEPELCVKLLQKPSIKNYSGLKTILQQASEQWIKDFLGNGGMGVLLLSLEQLGSVDSTAEFFKTVMRLECVFCIKSILNSTAGINYMAENIQFTRQLGRGLNFSRIIILETKLLTDNTYVKEGIRQFLKILVLVSLLCW